MDDVLLERDDGIASVVLNRPEKLNALSKAMWARLGEVMRDLAADGELRCVVLRGAGGKAFAAGADISEFESERSDPARARAYAEATEAAMGAVRGCRHPTVALIEGACVGGGLEIALGCDIRICGEGSRFGIPSNRIGLVIGWTEIEALVAVVGRAGALEILLEGRIFSADEARERGVVHRVVADDDVADEAYATARRIASGAPLTNRFHKQAIYRLAEPKPLTRAEHEAAFACYASEDYRTGWQAFLDKTTPEFKGR